jgi:hypothetical protein
MSIVYFTFSVSVLEITIGSAVLGCLFINKVLNTLIVFHPNNGALKSTRDFSVQMEISIIKKGGI